MNALAQAVNGKTERTILVSVIAPCRREAAYVDAFCRSLLEQDLPEGEWEALIADGMSDDGTREQLLAISRQHPQIRVIDNPGRIVSTGLNAAIREARGEFIVRMDLHTEYARDYMRRCVETIRATGADNVGGPWIARGRGLVSRAIAAVFHSPFGTGGARGHSQDYEGRVDTVYLGCWRKSTLERLGCFDEALVRNQDDELNLRITRSGGTVWQSPAIRSWYTPRMRLAALFRQYFQYGFWKVAVIRKHKQPASWRHLVPGICVLVILILLLLAVWASLAGMPDVLSGVVLTASALTGLYALACAAASVRAASRQGWVLLPLLPVIFGVYHASYGLGFLAGVVRGAGGANGSGTKEETIFSKLTR